MICLFVCLLNNAAVQVSSSCVRKLAKIKNMAVCKGDYCQLLHLKDNDYAHFAFLWKYSVLPSVPLIWLLVQVLTH